MKISTEIASAARHVGEEQAVAYIAKAGFDAWDFSMFRMFDFDGRTGTVLPTAHPLSGGDYLAFARRLKQVGTDNGIPCNQSHAPFPSCPEAVPYLKRAIECTAEAGGQICVIHPSNNKSAEENGQMFRELLPFAKACGVKIATENMWNWESGSDQASPAACSDPESFNAHLDAVNDEDFVACLDIGHAEMRGLHTSAPEMILALKNRLQALHIHDNDRWHDSHQLPFTMQIDFSTVIRALKSVGYQGYFTLEADAYLNGFSSDTVQEGLRQMAKAARRLADMFEGAAKETASFDLGI